VVYLFREKSTPNEQHDYITTTLLQLCANDILINRNEPYVTRAHDQEIVADTKALWPAALTGRPFSG
jgi:hypothetical protein